MKKTITFALLIILSGCLNKVFAQRNLKTVEIWQGPKYLGGEKQICILKISRDSLTSEASASLTWPFFYYDDLGVDSFSKTKDSLNFTFTVSQIITVRYKGAIVKKRCIGWLKIQNVDLPLNLELIKKLPSMRRPQTPRKPYPYIEEELVYYNRDSSTQFGATLTMPKKKGKFPVAVLVSSGSGMDRDNSMWGHKRSLVIANYLTKNGIAVLRIDDRGEGQTSEFPDGGLSTSKFASIETFAEDKRAAIQYLKTRTDIDTTKIGLIGHSEGADIACTYAAKYKDVAFIISLAGTGVNGRVHFLSVIKAKMDTRDTLEISKNISKFDVYLDILLTEPDEKAASNKVNEYIFKQDSLTKIIFGAKFINGTWDYNTIIYEFYKFYNSNSNSNGISLIRYDPEKTLKEVTCPLLALNGSKDMTVIADVSLAGFKKIKSKGIKTNIDILELPDLNHSFQHCKTCRDNELGVLQETISKEALKIMCDWIKKQMKN